MCRKHTDTTRVRRLCGTERGRVPFLEVYSARWRYKVYFHGGCVGTPTWKRVPAPALLHYIPGYMQSGAYLGDSCFSCLMAKAERVAEAGSVYNVYSSHRTWQKAEYWSQVLGGSVSMKTWTLLVFDFQTSLSFSRVDRTEFININTLIKSIMPSVPNMCFSGWLPWRQHFGSQMSYANHILHTR